MKQQQRKTATRVDRIVLPSSEQIREEAKAILEATDLKDLATALSDGERIDAYEPFTAWLAAGRHPSLFLRQMAEACIDALVDMHASEDVVQIMECAIRRRPRI